MERGSEGQDHIFVGPKVGRIWMPVWSMISDVSFEFGTICFWILASAGDFDVTGLPVYDKAFKFGI